MNADPNTLEEVGAMGLGRTLKELREARRLRLQEVSARLKFSVRQLEALENEDWSRLPAGMPLKGMVRNYGRFLEADTDALLVMLESQAPGEQPGLGAEGLRRPAAVRAADMPLHTESVSRPWGWLVIILLFLAVAVFYAIGRGWVPDSWLIFDWLKALKT